ERLPPDHGLKLGDQLTRITVGEPRIDQILGRRAPELLEPLAFGRPKARVPVPLVGGTPPQTERLLEQATGLPGVPGSKEPVPIAGQLLEAQGVDHVSGAFERVPSPPGHDDVTVRAG